MGTMCAVGGLRGQEGNVMTYVQCYCQLISMNQK